MKEIGYEYDDESYLGSNRAKPAEAMSATTDKQEPDETLTHLCLRMWAQAICSMPTAPDGKAAWAGESGYGLRSGLRWSDQTRRRKVLPQLVCSGTCCR